MIIAICYAFFYIFETISCYIFFEKIFACQLDNKKTIIIYLTSLIIQYILSFCQISLLNLIAFFISNSLIVWICYKEHLKTILFSSGILTIFMLISEIIVVHASALIFNFDFLMYQDNTLVMITQASLSKLFFFIIIYLSSFLVKRKELYYANGGVLLLSLLPITSIIIIHLLAYLGANTKFNVIYNYLLSICSVLLLLANILVFYVYELVQKSNFNKTQLLLTQQKYEISNEYYDILSREYENSRILVHDIKNHIQYMESELLANNYTGVLNYINSLRTNFNLNNRIIYSGNKLVDVIINKYLQLSKEYDIDYYIENRQVDLNFMEHSDVIALLDNLFDNAIEAAKNSNNKQVSCIISKENTNFIKIEILNSCDCVPHTIRGELISNKDDVSQHGVGIKSIRKVVNKYDGNFSWSYNEENHSFRIIIVLCKNKNQFN